MSSTESESVNFVNSKYSLDEHVVPITAAPRSTCVKDPVERPIQARAYRRTVLGEVVFFTLSILTAGIYALVSWWLPTKSFKLRYGKCSAKDADFFFIDTVREDGKQQKRIVKAFHANIGVQAMGSATINDGKSDRRASPVVIFVFRCKRFILRESGDFQDVCFDISLPYDEVHALGCGIVDEQLVDQRRKVFGKCSVEVKLTPVLTLLFTELLHPFYIFQIFAFTLWTWDEYYYYASSILIISIIFTIIELLETMSNERRLHALANCSCFVNLFQKAGLEATVRRTNDNISMESLLVCGADDHENRVSADKVWQVSSTELVPEHVFEVERDMILPCDAIVLSGTVIINESMLTGESAPVLKTPLPRSSSVGLERYDMKYNSSSTVFAGTRVIAAKRSDVVNLRVLAIAVRTGFSTLQGSMMRSIIHPAPNKFTFYRDSFRFLGVLFIVSIFGGIASVFISFRDGISTKETIVRCLDLVTVLVPPALPAAMSAGAAITVGMLLRRWHIMCISPTRINVSGQVNTVVFDKTGTLTENDLELVGVVPVQGDDDEEETVTAIVKAPTKYSLSLISTEGAPLNTGRRLSYSVECNPLNLPTDLVQAISTCNSLSLVDGEVIGEPLEKLMVKYSGWTVHDVSTNAAPFKSVWEGGNDVRKGSNMETKSTRCSPSDNLSDGAPCTSGDNAADVNCKEPLIYMPSNGDLADSNLCITSDTAHTTKDPFDYCVDVDGMSSCSTELRNASMTQIAAAIRRVYDCEMAVPVTMRPPGSTGVLSVLLKRGASLDKLASGVQSAAQFAKRGSPPFDAFSSDGDGNGFVYSPMTNNDVIELGIVKRFDFAAELQRMSVVVRDPLTQELHVFCKGSPEKVFELSRPESVPKNTIQVLETYTRRGMRVIGFAGKAIGALRAASVKDLDRQAAENDLTFLGLMVFANQLKPQTKHTIESLRDAGCFCLMATGDNSLTAVAISMESGILLDSNTIISADVPTHSAACEEYSSIMWTKHDAKGKLPSETSPDLRRFIKGVDHRDISFVVSGKAFRQLRKLHDSISQHAKCSKPKTSSKCISKSIRRDSKEPLTVVVHPMSYGSVDAAPNRWMMLSFAVSLNDDILVSEQIKSKNVMEKALNIKMNAMVPLDVNISLFEFVLRHVVVYSRMSPDDKESLVVSLQSLNTIVAMCGDGANDVAALKAADIGVSLSDAEASIAAPFTSTTKSIQSCLDVLREGRAALLSSFQIFKFISLYSIVQFVSMTSLYWFGNNFTDQQFVWTDIVQVLPLSVLISWTDAATKLTPRLPTGSLISPPVLISLFGQIFIQSFFNIIICVLLVRQPWYIPFAADEGTGLGKGDELSCHANTVVFLVTNLQYPIVCLAISQNRPWRKPVITNIPLLIWFCVLFTIGLVFIFTSQDEPGLFGWLYRLLYLTNIPEYFRYYILGLVLSNFVCSVSYEYLISSFFVGWYERKSLNTHCIYAHPLPCDRRFAVEFSG